MVQGACPQGRGAVEMQSSSGVLVKSLACHVRAVREHLIGKVWWGGVLAYRYQHILLPSKCLVLLIHNRKDASSVLFVEVKICS